MADSLTPQIPITKPFFGDEEVNAVIEPLKTGWVAQGPFVKQFEKKFSSFTESVFSIATTSCTTALHLSVAMLGLKPGDEVILPAVWELLRTFPELKILYVPHEPGKTVIEKYRNIFQQEGFAPAVITDKANLVLPGERVVILGVVGVLASLYWQGQVAYIGGGFSKGGVT